MRFGHIVAWCPHKSNNKNEDSFRSRKYDTNKGYKDNGKKAWYIDEEESNDEFEDHDDEVVYVAMKNYCDEGEETACLYLMWTKLTDGSLKMDIHITLLETKVSSLPLSITMEKVLDLVMMHPVWLKEKEQ